MARLMYTIGHSTRSLEEFLGVLKDHGIQVLVDVRSYPYSKHSLHFRRENLCPALREAGLRYLWLGPWLGGRRRGGYLAWMDTADFARGLAALERIGERRVTAYMCAEIVFFRCHRRHISDALVARGWDVEHILRAGDTYHHRLLPEEPRLDL